MTLIFLTTAFWINNVVLGEGLHWTLIMCGNGVVPTVFEPSKSGASEVNSLIVQYLIDYILQSDANEVKRRLGNYVPEDFDDERIHCVKCPQLGSMSCGWDIMESVSEVFSLRRECSCDCGVNYSTETYLLEHQRTCSGSRNQAHCVKTDYRGTMNNNETSLISFTDSDDVVPAVNSEQKNQPEMLRRFLGVKEDDHLQKTLQKNVEGSLDSSIKVDRKKKTTFEISKKKPTRLDERNCTKCMCNFTGELEYLNHHTVMTTGYACCKCSTEIKGKSKLMKHMNKSCGIEMQITPMKLDKWFCRKCMRNFISELEYLNHYSATPTGYNCCKCSAKIMNKFKLMKHMNKSCEEETQAIKTKTSKKNDTKKKCNKRFTRLKKNGK
jgi:hypothetical protein